jgi:hypothetical protein
VRGKKAAAGISDGDGGSRTWAGEGWQEGERLVEGVGKRWKGRVGNKTREEVKREWSIGFICCE